MLVLLKLFRNKFSLPVLLFCLCFFVYVARLSPSVYGGDVGDLVTAIAVKGVPHPSGYPLFMLMGILFNALPLPHSIAWKVGLVSVFSASAAVVLLYLIVKILNDNKLIALVTALTLAFLYPFWLYAEVAEVFAFTYFFLLLLLYVALVFYKKKNIKTLYLLSFLTGLSFNHEITVLILPTIIILVIVANWRIICSPRTIGLCLLFFLIGLLPYLYIPIAALHHPPVNWDRASNLKNFIKLVSRAGYGWAYKPSSNSVEQFILPLSLYFYYWKIKMSIIPILLSVLGFLYLIKRNKTLFMSFFLGFFLTGPFFIVYFSLSLESNFTIGVLERFYTISGIFLILFFSFGLQLIYGLFAKLVSSKSNTINRKMFRYCFYVPLFIIPYSLFTINSPKVDLHDMWIGDYLGEDLLSGATKNSTVSVDGDDTVVFNTLYVKYVLKKRPDIDLHVKYTTDLTNEKFINLYRSAFKKYKKIPIDDAYLLAAESISKEKHFFSYRQLQHSEKKYGREIEWIPYGLVYALGNDYYKNLSNKEYARIQKAIWNKFHIEELKKSTRSQNLTLTLSHIPLQYVALAVTTGDYFYSRYKDDENAKLFFQKAIDIDPDHEAGYEGMGYIYFQKKDCAKAEYYYNKMIDVNRWNKKGYNGLYATYNECMKDKKKAKIIQNMSNDIFQGIFPLRQNL